MVPQCTHWLGHRFVARYETQAPTQEQCNQVERLTKVANMQPTGTGVNAAGVRATPPNIPAIVLKLMAWVNPPKYVCDVCVRCGEPTAVERVVKTPAPPVEVDSPTSAPVPEPATA